MFDKLEISGPHAGELIDSRLHLYEMKQKRPPIRLYYHYAGKELQIFAYEMKRSQKHQQRTIDKLRERFRNQDRPG